MYDYLSFYCNVYTYMCIYIYIYIYIYTLRLTNTEEAVLGLIWTYKALQENLQIHFAVYYAMINTVNQ